MGYTHYWRREITIPVHTFNAIREDFEKLLIPMADAGIMLAGGLGTGTPEITPNKIWFNGLESCGHAPNSAISIPWPTRNAGGVGDNRQGQDGEWFAGASLDTRCCNGDCSYETFAFNRVFKKESWQTPEDGKWFACCKTAFRPYDIAVTAFLIVAKHHMGDKLKVSTDGEDQHWFDAKMLCQTVLGYGLELGISETEGTLEAVQVAA